MTYFKIWQPFREKIQKMQSNRSESTTHTNQIKVDI